MKNSIIYLNREAYSLGQAFAITTGINGNGKTVICKGIITRGDEADEYIFHNGGIHILISDLSDFYVDTPNNRKWIKANLFS